MKPIHYIAIGCILASLLGCAFALGRVTARISPVETIIRDTVTKVVAVYKDFPNPQKEAFSGYLGVPLYKFITDTIRAVETVYSHDTTVVYLPREQKYYSEADGKLRLWISGYEPRLDRYELDLPTTTITNTVKEKPSRWGLGVSAGYGAAMQADKTVVLSPFIGIGIQYNFLSW